MKKNILNVFIDETTSYGQTLNACFRLADNLGGNAGNYNWAVLFPIKSETAPWDIFEADESAYYPQTHPKFLSTHLYMSPKGDIDSSIASLPTLNQNYNSNICVSQIAHKLYDIGQNIV